MVHRKYRLVARCDFDGLVCGILLKFIDLIDDIKFVHPKDMQDGIIRINGRDIITNLSYAEQAHLNFAHYHNGVTHIPGCGTQVIDSSAPSAARVVYNYFGGSASFPQSWSEMVDAVDRACSADYTIDDVLHPTGWTLLNFLIDPRTGLGRFRGFLVTNDVLVMDLIEYCRDHGIEDILAQPDVQERAAFYRSEELAFRSQLARCSTVHDRLVVLDLRGEPIIHAGNRFMIYVVFPTVNASIYVVWGVQRRNTVFAVGKSILDRSCRADIGELMAWHGGGGHARAGTCQIDNDRAESVLADLVMRISASGQKDTRQRDGRP